MLPVALIRLIVKRGLFVGREQDKDSIRISSDSLIKIIQAHFDVELGEDKVRVVDLELLKRKGLAEIFIVPGLGGSQK